MSTVHLATASTPLQVTVSRFQFGRCSSLLLNASTTHHCAASSTVHLAHQSRSSTIYSAANSTNHSATVQEALRANNLSDYRLFIAAEPGCDETLKICRKVDFMPCQLFVNPKRIGIHWNNKSLYERAFGNGSEFNVAIEDDTPLSPDALDLANWFWSLPSRDDYLLLNLFNGSRSGNCPVDIEECDSFCPWAYCVTQEKYERLVAPHWMCDDRGWDWSICAAMTRFGHKSLRPVLSRSRNIGKHEGTYCSPAIHEESFGGHVASAGRYGKDFLLCRSS